MEQRMIDRIMITWITNDNYKKTTKKQQIMITDKN